VTSGNTPHFYTQAVGKGPIDGGDIGVQCCHLSAYCFIHVQCPCIMRTSPKFLMLVTFIMWLSLPTFFSMEWLDKWGEIQGSTLEVETWQLKTDRSGDPWDFCPWSQRGKNRWH